MVAFSTLALASASLLAGYATAHPGESHDHIKMKRELVARDNGAAVGARSLGSCSNSAASQALKARSIQRRAEKVKNIRQKRGITTRKSYDPNKTCRGRISIAKLSLQKPRRASVRSRTCRPMRPSTTTQLAQSRTTCSRLSRMSSVPIPAVSWPLISPMDPITSWERR